MRITLAAVGRMKRSELAPAYDDYAKRLSWPLTLKEVEEKRPLPAEQLMVAEGAALLSSLPTDAYVIALERSGKNISSEAFAALLQGLQDEGRREVAFVIGGADGLSAEVIERSDFKLSFGAMVLPHMLARTLLVEQLFRAQSILAGHPYHRGV